MNEGSSHKSNQVFLNFMSFLQDKTLSHTSVYDHKIKNTHHNTTAKYLVNVVSKPEVDNLKLKAGLNQSLDDCKQSNQILIMNSSTDEPFQRSVSLSKSQKRISPLGMTNAQSQHSSLSRPLPTHNVHSSSKKNLLNSESIERRLTNLTSLSNYRSTNITQHKSDSKPNKPKKQEHRPGQQVHVSITNRMLQTRNPKGQLGKTEVKSEARKFTTIISSIKKSPPQNSRKIDVPQQLPKTNHFKLSPKIEPKLKGHHGKVPSQDSKQVSYKERTLRASQIGQHVMGPKVIHMDLNAAAQRVEIHPQKLFQEATVDQKNQLEMEEDKSPSVSLERQKINCNQGGTMPQQKQFSSFVDSYHKHQKGAQATLDTKAMNTSMENSFSADLNNSNFVVPFYGHKGAIPVSSPLRNFQQRQRSQDKKFSKTKLVKYNLNMSQLSGENMSPNSRLLLFKSRNPELTNEVQQPLSSHIKTKAQYFNVNNTTEEVSSPFDNRRLRSPLLQIASEGDTNDVLPNTQQSQSPSTSKTNHNRPIVNKDHGSILNTVHQTAYSPSMFMRTANQFIFPDTSPKLQLNMEDANEALKLQLPNDHLSQNHAQAYFNNDEQMPPKSARLQASNKKMRSNKHKQNNSMYDEEVKGFSDIRSSAPAPIQYCDIGCSCPRVLDSVGCKNAIRWIELTYQNEYQQQIYQKVYEGFYFSSPRQQKRVTTQQILKDVERTFQQHSFFNRSEIQESLVRVLQAYAHYEPAIGYVQGMSFLAASLIYHCGEVATFWLLIALMDQYSLKDIYRQNLPGLIKHEAAIEKLGRVLLEDVFDHFDKYDIKINFFCTEWIMCIFTNYIPLDLNHIFLNKFFEEKWAVFYRVSISVLKYFQAKILKRHDLNSIIGEIKQAREGSEHLKPVPSQSSIASFSSVESGGDGESQRMQKFVVMWSEIMELATSKWENLNSEFMQKHHKHRNSDIQNKRYLNNNRQSVIELRKA